MRLMIYRVRCYLALRCLAETVPVLATSVFYRETVMYLQDALPTAYKSFPANVPIGTGRV